MEADLSGLICVAEEVDIGEQKRLSFSLNGASRCLRKTFHTPFVALSGEAKFDSPLPR